MKKLMICFFCLGTLVAEESSFLPLNDSSSDQDSQFIALFPKEEAKAAQEEAATESKGKAEGPSVPLDTNPMHLEPKEAEDLKEATPKKD